MRDETNCGNSATSETLSITMIKDVLLLEPLIVGCTWKF